MATAQQKLDKAIKAVSKYVDKESMIEIDPDKMTETHPHLSTGSMVIDYLIGGAPNSLGVRPCPGFPRGKIVNLYGMESSGKTTLALSAAAETIRSGGAVIYVDWEHEVTPMLLKELRVPTEGFRLYQPDTFEEGIAIIVGAVQSEVDLIVMDSVGSAVPKSLIQSDISEYGESGRVGKTAQAWGNFLKKIKGPLRKSGSCLLGISQLRSNINTTGYGGPTHTAEGGNAWRFYPALRIMLRRSGTLKDNVYDPTTHKTDKQSVGMKVKIKLDKCKVSGSAKQEMEFYIRNGYGIDNFYTALEVLTAHKDVQKKGSWYSFMPSSGNEVKGQGQEGFRKSIEDGGFEAEFMKKAMGWMTTPSKAEGNAESDDSNVQEETESEEINGNMDDWFE